MKRPNYVNAVVLLAGLLSAVAATVHAADKPLISINDLAITRPAGGGATAAFTIQLSAPAATDVTVEYTTADRRARAGVDYKESNGTVVIPRGEQSVPLVVRVLPAKSEREDRDFAVVLSRPGGADLAETSGLCTILGASSATANSREKGRS